MSSLWRWHQTYMPGNVEGVKLIAHQPTYSLHNHLQATPTWRGKKMHLENGRSLEPNPIQVHLELGSILGGKASLLQMKICAPETYIRLKNRGKGNPQLSSEIRVTERERERGIKRIYHTRDDVDTLPNNCKSLYFSTRTIHIPPLQCNAMLPVSTSLVLEHPLHNDFIPHAPRKKKPLQRLPRAPT